MRAAHVHEARRAHMHLGGNADARADDVEPEFAVGRFVRGVGVARILEGYQLADIIPTFGSVNMIGGECDR